MNYCSHLNNVNNPGNYLGENSQSIHLNKEHQDR